jgi:16S rRNA pseudouridine516 synthase
MRLDQFLTSVLGVSRKDAKIILKQKKVLVNQKLETNSSLQINETKDEVIYNNQILKYQEHIYLILNKPNGYITSTEDYNHQTVMDLINHPLKHKLFPVGRLDIDTEGLLLITNNGPLSHELLSPKKHVSKTYYVEIDKTFPTDGIEILKNGIMLDGTISVAEDIELINETSLNLTITEGKYHQVKRMMAHLGLNVTYLKRISFGNLKLPNDLEIGSFRELTLSEVELLINSKKGEE